MDTQHTHSWRRGKTLKTDITSKWSEAEVQENDLLEGMRIFSDFSAADEGRNRQLVCRLNPLHPNYEENRLLIEAAPDLLKALKEAYAFLSGSVLLTIPQKVELEERMAAPIKKTIL